MLLKASDVAKSLERKGMTPTNTHHVMYRKVVSDGGGPVITRISHGAKEISQSLISKMARQCELTSQEFRALVECSLSEVAWDELVRVRRSAQGA